METLLWEPSQPPGYVRCMACMHHCVLPPGQTGRCGVRRNTAGTLRSLVSGGIVSAHADPVEKKPLYHYLPGTSTFSFATEGCNFRCSFCQNAEISQHPTLTSHIRQQAAHPDALLRTARNLACSSIAFTYTEPTVFIELMQACAQKALDAGLGTVMVSNGYQSPAALSLLAPLIQAANIDLKSMNPHFYREHCKATLQPVLDNLCRMRDNGWWLEVTTLLIPSLNDSPEELEEIARFIAGKLGSHVPWHVSAFHPAFAMQNCSATPPDRIELACRIGHEAGLSFVYPGNVSSRAIHATRSTLCPQCGAPCIDRDSLPQSGFSGLCPSCGSRLPGVWNVPTEGSHD